MEETIDLNPQSRELRAIVTTGRARAKAMERRVSKNKFNLMSLNNSGISEYIWLKKKIF